MSDVSIPVGSIEYVKTPVTSDVSLDAQVVAISVNGAAGTYLPAQWLGSAGLTRTARTTSPVTFATKGNLQVYVKVTDTPEVPIMKAGTIRVT